jgi:serine/threonine-protein kinase
VSDGLSPDRWARVEELFIEALDLSPTERGAFLDERCADDPEVRGEVESLLSSHDDVGPLPTEEEETRLRGRFPERIGDYRIVRQLGEGGMGVVLLAIREAAGFEQTVALKILRGAFVDPAVARRLEEERRILARLEHPGIARLIDGGVTEDGQPYYAMEYVAGESILDYCDTRRLGIEERLELFIEACEAVHYAHQQLVVHRDLKPSNLMVTTDHRPKLLDFGIAKEVQPDDVTGHTGLWVTPAYASPEQVNAGPASTLSDVYALGILLCELLTGFRPYRTSGVPPTELGRIITEVPPRKPSDLATSGPPPTEGSEPTPDEALELAAAARSTQPARLSRALRGDLDLIVLTAIEKDPQRRYGSARRLAEDLRRFLEGRPIEARPPSAAYRLGRFARRHRAALVTAALVLVALGLGGSAAVWQARRAEMEGSRADTEADRARQVTALVTEIFRLGDPTLTQGDTLGMRQLLSESRTQVEESLTGDPILQATLFLELGRVYANLGSLEEATRLSRDVLSLREEFEHGTLAYGEALGFAGLVDRQAGRSVEAIRNLEAALALYDDVGAPEDEDRATLLVALGWELRSDQQYERAEALFREAMAIHTSDPGGASPAVAGSMFGLASTLHDQGAFDEAENMFRSAIEMGGTDRPNAVAAAALSNLGMIRRLREQYIEAEPLTLTALEMYESLFQPDHPDVIGAREQWASELAALGRYREADALYATTLDQAVRVLGEEHPRTRGAREGMASVDWTLARYDLALARIDSVVAAKTRAHGGDHPGTVYSILSLGDIEVERGRPEAALTWYGEALAMGERLGGTQGVYGMLARAGQARAHMVAGDLERAAALADTARTMAEELLRPSHRYVQQVLRTQAELFIAQGRPAEAIQLLEGVREVESQVRPSPHSRIGQTDLLMAEAWRAMDRPAEAEAAYRSALAELVELPSQHPLTARARQGLASVSQ